MTIRKEYLILGGIIIALVLVLVVINLGNSAGQNLPGVPSVKKDDITKISFKSANGETILAKDKNNKWLIQPMNYPADKSAVDSMLSNITDLKISALISDKKIYDRYNLDDANKIGVTAFAGDKEVRNFDIGKVSDTSSFTFVKLANNNNVYSISGNARMVFDKKLADLRDKVVMNLKKEEITEIVLENGKQTVRIKKEVKPAPATDKKDDKTKVPEEPVWKSDLSDTPVQVSVINDILDGMSNLTCEEFPEGSSKQDLSAKPFTYRTTARGPKDYIVTFADNGKDNKYAAISSESDFVFTLIGWKAQKLMRKFDKGQVN
jgi:hypothetical protein